MGLVRSLVHEEGVPRQVSPQPGQCLLAEAGALFGIELGSVFALATASEGSRAGGVIAVLSIQVEVGLSTLTQA